MKKRLFIFNFVLIAVIAVLNHIANAQFLYWKFWWFDIMMHFLGGLWFSSQILWIYYFSGYFKNTNSSRGNILKISLLSALIIGISWEIFEFVFNIVSLSDGWYYVFDTIKDLVDDTLGSVVAFNLYSRILNKEEKVG